MDNEQLDNQDKRNTGKSRLDKILAQPGIHEAMDLVRYRAWQCALDETIEQGARGELGDELKAILESPLKSDEDDPLDNFMKHKLVGAIISDSFDELLEELAPEAGGKIADLWGLSKSAAELISRVIYAEEYTEIVRQKGVHAPLTLLLSKKDLENNKTFAEHYHEFEEQGIEVLYLDHIPKGRIYLDVTELTNQQLRSVYKAIVLCRKYIGIKHEDLRVGAPKSFDTNKALEADLLRRTGISKKEIVKRLGFKVYYDLPQGNFPHLYKYLKLGKQIDGRLGNLESYLSNLHPTIND